MASLPPSTRFDATYEGDTSTMNPARCDVRSWIGASNVAVSAPIDDVVLALSELISNAIEAAPGCIYRVRISVEVDRLGLIVTNDGTSVLPESSQWTPENVLASSGRGLAIVAAVSDSVETFTEGGATSVVAWFLQAAPE